MREFGHYRLPLIYPSLTSVSCLCGRKFTEVDVLLPKKLAANATLNLVLETIQTHMTEPWPEYAGQKDEQALRYTTDLYVISPYPTLVQRTRVKYVSNCLYAIAPLMKIEQWSLALSLIPHLQTSSPSPPIM